MVRWGLSYETDELKGLFSVTLYIPGGGEARSFKASFFGASSNTDSSLIPPGEAITVGVGPHSELSKIVL